MERGTAGIPGMAMALAALLTGCMEGPAGPAGPAGGGGNGVPRDSVVLDLMGLAVYYAKHYRDTNYTPVQFSPEIEARYRDFDTSMLGVDSVIDAYSRKPYLETFLRTKYPIAGWSGSTTLKNVHDCQEGDAASGWFAKFSKIVMDYSGDPEGKVGVKVQVPYVCAKTEITPTVRTQNYGGFYYFPGKGISLTYMGIIIVMSHRLQYAEGTLTLYYW